MQSHPRGHSRVKMDLKASDWGSEAEIMEMAKMERTPPPPEKDLKEYRKKIVDILRGIRSKGSLSNHYNDKLKATLSDKSINKLISDKALDESFEKEAHWFAVVNVHKLFENAIEPYRFELDPSKNNQDLKERHVLYAPMEYKGNIVTVKLTVKEYDAERGTRLYSVEAVDVVLKEREGWSLGNGVHKSALLAPARPSLDYTIANIFVFVKPQNQDLGAKKEDLWN